MIENMNSAAKSKELDNFEPNSPLVIKDELKRKPMPKPKISDFEIGEIVGIGNFGKVYKAFNKLTEKVCALKVLKKESVAQMKQVDHIISEREVLQYLQDKNAETNENDRCPFLMGIFSSF